MPASVARPQFRRGTCSYTLGVGLELAVSKRVSIRTELLFTDPGKRLYSVPDGSASESFDTRLLEGRIGLSVRY